MKLKLIIILGLLLLGSGCVDTSEYICKEKGGVWLEKRGTMNEPFYYSYCEIEKEVNELSDKEIDGVRQALREWGLFERAWKCEDRERELKEGVKITTVIDDLGLKIIEEPPCAEYEDLDRFCRWVTDGWGVADTTSFGEDMCCVPEGSKGYSCTPISSYTLEPECKQPVEEPQEKEFIDHSDCPEGFVCGEVGIKYV